MLVHRDNDDQSDDGTDVGKPRLVASGHGPGRASGDSAKNSAEDCDDGEDSASRDNGKSHLIGDALKSVYRRTLEEEIPDDFLDLLKQLK